MTFAPPLPELAVDRSLVDGFLADLLDACDAASHQSVQSAVRYAVLGPAQRIRPILALRVARLFGRPDPLVLRAAAAVELLHCASLIIDDLPCMDDSPVRRNRPSVHIQFGEATAVLAAFALVALAARSVVETDGAAAQRNRLASFQIALLRSLDCAGLIAGQALDLQLAGVSCGRTQDRVIALKTAPLFHLAVKAGMLFAPAGFNETALLECFGHEFGLAFQLTDDLLDGDELLTARLEEKLGTLRAAIAPFGPRALPLEEMLAYLYARAPRCPPARQAK